MNEQSPSRPLFEKEIKQTEDLGTRYPDTVTADGKPLFDDDTYYARLVDKTTLKDKVGRLVGREDREQYRRTFYISAGTKDVWRPHRQDCRTQCSRFHSADEVARSIREGLMTGDILPIGRLIDGTFGKGTLRKIGDWIQMSILQGKIREIF